MGYNNKGKTGSSHWFKDAAWDCCSTAVVGIVLASIALCVIWLLMQMAGIGDK